MKTQVRPARETPTDRFRAGWLICGLAVTVGCTAAHQPERSQTDKPQQQRLMVHDAGRVLAGTGIRHIFQFRNRTRRHLCLRSQDDVQLSCGCAAAHVRNHRLKPGQVTPVEVQLNTIGKHGLVTETATLTWTAGDQTTHEYAFAVRAEIQSALTLTPNEISFNRHEAGRGIKKRIVCESALNLDWPNARLESPAKGLRVERCLPAATPWTFQVSCDSSDDRHGAGQQGIVRLTVPLATPHGRDRPTEFSAELPVFWTLPAPLRVSPAVLRLRPNPDGTVWKGWFILTGDVIRARVTLQQIDCPIAKLNFEQRRLGDNALRVDTTVRLSGASPADRPRWIAVVLSSGERRTVRVFYTNPDLNEEL